MLRIHSYSRQAIDHTPSLIANLVYALSIGGQILSLAGSKVGQSVHVKNSLVKMTSFLGCNQC